MNDKRVLYIDDEVDLLELAESFFEDENLSIDTSSNLDEAFYKIKLNQYEVIISDAKMPNGGGFELFQVIKKEGHFKGKVILVTGNLDSSSDYQKMGFDMILYKPIKFEELVQEVKLLLKDL